MKKVTYQPRFANSLDLELDWTLAIINDDPDQFIDECDTFEEAIEYGKDWLEYEFDCNFIELDPEILTRFYVLRIESFICGPWHKEMLDAIKSS